MQCHLLEERKGKEIVMIRYPAYLFIRDIFVQQGDFNFTLFFLLRSFTIYIWNVSILNNIRLDFDIRSIFVGMHSRRRRLAPQAAASAFALPLLNDSCLWFALDYIQAQTLTQISFLWKDRPMVASIHLMDHTDCVGKPQTTCFPVATRQPRCLVRLNQAILAVTILLSAHIDLEHNPLASVQGTAQC